MTELTIVKEVRLFKVSLDIRRESEQHSQWWALSRGRPDNARSALHSVFIIFPVLANVCGTKRHIMGGNEWRMYKNTVLLGPKNSLHNPWCWHPEDGVRCLERSRLCLHTGEGSEDVAQHHSGLQLYPSFTRCFCCLFFTSLVT